ncbi:tetratricopeptide repeat protein [Streptomyces marincola]|uniref:Tetratricopeptide repeat-containing protein n=1 Tax=Streptomyces marincola TaxID=2878388 RepID=A0A1W7D3L4_9ACTN|nr:tetratricopeptide repeat protein [Streptomyces marincola]ARQ71509.1 hypothetical protein CAG99_24150 [Streptomyces marincola]
MPEPVRIGHNEGIVSFGDHTINMLYRAERMTVLPDALLRPSAEVPPVRGVIGQPPLPTALFVGREAEFAALDAALAGRAPAERRLYTLCGLDGVGKTTLAARYAATRGAVHPQICWLRADSAGAVDDGLGRIALSLEPHLAELPSPLLRERALNWLSTHDDWLLVLDQVTDRAHVRELLARAPGGAYLLTTDDRSLANSLGPFSDLGPLPAGTAEELLAAHLSRGGVDAAAADIADICRSLGHLPLAVAQAGAFLAETRLAPAEYAGTLRARPQAAYHPPAPGAPDNRSLVTIWRLATERVSDVPGATDALAFCSWLAPEGIPRELLRVAVPVDNVDAALGALASHGLIGLGPETISVHPLLQHWYRTRTRPTRRGEESLNEGFSAAHMALAAFLPQTTEPETWPRWRGMLPHLEALQRNAPNPYAQAAVVLANNAGAYLNEQGEVARSVPLLEKAWAVAYRHFGIEHPATFMSEAHLARAYEDAGRIADLRSLRSRVLGAWQEARGEDDEQTLGALANVAAALLLDGDGETAASLYRVVLGTLLSRLGPDHKKVLRVRDGLADAYEVLGDLNACLIELETNAAAWTRVCGPADPATIVCLRRLAAARTDLGDTDGAVLALEQLLRDITRARGHDAPEALTVRTDLALTRQPGDMAGSVALLDHVATDSRRVLGDTHQGTVFRRRKLAEALLTTGDTRRGVAEYRRLHADLTTALGPAQRGTLRAQCDVGVALVLARDFEAAIAVLAETAAGQAAALGADDEDVLRARDVLAAAFLLAGRVDRARQEAEALAADCRRVLGAGHERTRLAEDLVARAHAGPRKPRSPAAGPPVPPMPHFPPMPRVPPPPVAPPPPPRPPGPPAT